MQYSGIPDNSNIENKLNKLATGNMVTIKPHFIEIQKFLKTSLIPFLKTSFKLAQLSKTTTRVNLINLTI